MQQGEIREHPSPCERLTGFLLPIPTRRSDGTGMLCCCPFVRKPTKNACLKIYSLFPNTGVLYTSLQLGFADSLGYFCMYFQTQFSKLLLQARIRNLLSF